MGVTNNSSAALGRFEPSMTRTFLPRCSSCHAPHPLARRPAAPADSCPDCGEPSGTPGATVTERAVLPGLSGWIAERCFRIADALTRLSKGL